MGNNCYDDAPDIESFKLTAVIRDRGSSIPPFAVKVKLENRLNGDIEVLKDELVLLFDMGTQYSETINGINYIRYEYDNYYTFSTIGMRRSHYNGASFYYSFTLVNLSGNDISLSGDYLNLFVDPDNYSYVYDKETSNTLPFCNTNTPTDPVHEVRITNIPPKNNVDQSTDKEELNVSSTKRIQAIKSSDHVNENINLFPNPCQDFITLTGMESIKNIVITNLYGQKIYNWENNSTFGSDNQQRIDMSQQASGLYLCRIITDSNEEIIRKFVKR